MKNMIFLSLGLNLLDIIINNLASKQELNELKTKITVLKKQLKK